MINSFLQFIKKQQLAIKLARFDSLFVISGLRTFKQTLFIARFFLQKKDRNPLLNLQEFLQFENNPLLYAIYDEITARTDIIPIDSYLMPTKNKSLSGVELIKTTHNLKDIPLYLSIVKEVVNIDLPKLREQYNFFEKRLEVVQDLRLFASELEALYTDLDQSSLSCPIEVDWVKTSQHELFLSFDQECTISAKLPISAQENLSKLFAFLIFEKNSFISIWNGVVFDDKGKVGFVDIDYVYKITPPLRQYAADYITHRKKPNNMMECKVHRALSLLEEYCSDIKVFKPWQEYFSQEIQNYIMDENADEAFLALLEANGLGFPSKQSVIMTNPKDIDYLLDASRHKKDPRFKKTTILYWGPLLLLIIYFLFFF